jgi:hypothetical protein
LAPIAYSVVFVGLTISFARRAFGPSASFFTGFYLALPPLFLLTWSVKARGGYAELLALGAWILWLTLDLGERRDGHCGWVALGGVVGLALWTDPLAVVYVVPAALYLALRCRRHLLRWTTGAAVGAAALTSYPMLRANLQSGGATLRDLAGANASQPLTAELFRHNLSGVGQTSLSVLLGFLQASSNVTGFAAAASAHRIAALAGAAVGVTLLLALVALGLWSIPRVLRLAPEPVDLLAWVGLMAVALSASSQIESLHLTEPRYLLPLYALAPLGGALAQRVEKTRPGRSAMLAALVLVLAMNVRSWVRYTPALAAPVLSGQVVRADDPALSRLLAERGDHAIYADYWIVYSVAFVSKEQVVGGVIDDDLRVGFNRYIPFAIAADQSPDPALVVVAGSPAETKLRAWLAGVSARYVVTASGNLHVYDRLAPRFAPG